jgi:hypothetical protein
VELPYFPNLKIACGHFKTGRTDSEEHRTLPAAYGRWTRAGTSSRGHRQLDGRRQEPHPRRRLPAAGTDQPQQCRLDHRHVVAIERQDESGDNQYLLRVVTKTKRRQYVLKANNPAYEDLQATDEMRTLARLKA